MTDPLIIGVSGHSGAGKTTLIESLLPRLGQRNLRVAVIKRHHQGGVDWDRPGKDSDRFMVAGAQGVVLGAHGERMGRWSVEEPDWHHGPATWFPDADLVIAEGFKEMTWPTLWLGDDAPTSTDHLIATLRARPTVDLDDLTDRIWTQLTAHVRARPLIGALLIGGSSRRMGQPKAAIQTSDGQTWAAHVAACLTPHVSELLLIGAGPTGGVDAPIIPDADPSAGPLSGLLSVTRLRPTANILAIPCDLPDLSADDLSLLTDALAPAIDAIHATTDNEPTLSLPVLLTPSSFPTVATTYQSGHRAVHRFLSEIRCRPVPVPTTTFSRLRGINQLPNTD